MRLWCRGMVLLGLVAALFAFSVLVPGRPDPGAAQALTAGPVRPPSGQSHLSRAEAVRSASGGAPSPVHAQLTDYRTATALLGEGADPAVGPATVVWLVTVFHPQEYTVILNGTDGTVIDSCLGCQPH